MAASLPFLLRNWQAILGIGAALILSALLYIRTDQRDDARQGWDAEKKASILFATRVRAKAEEIGRNFALYSRRVEQDQATVTQETSREYQDRLAELRARVDRLRASAARGTGAGGPGQSRVPGLPDGTSRFDAAALDNGLSFEQRVVATEQAIRLEALQGWVRRQAEISRQMPTLQTEE